MISNGNALFSNKITFFLLFHDNMSVNTLDFKDIMYKSGEQCCLLILCCLFRGSVAFHNFKKRSNIFKWAKKGKLSCLQKNVHLFFSGEGKNEGTKIVFLKESNWAYMPLWDEVRSYLTLKEVFQTRLVCKSWSKIKHIPLVFEFEDNCPPEDAPLENLQVIHYCGCANKFEENGSGDYSNFH